MNCESDITLGNGFLKDKQFMGPDSEMPTIEVYVTGSFSGTPIILTKTLQLGFRKKQMRKGMLDSIPEYEATESQDKAPSRFPLQVYLNFILDFLENCVLLSECLVLLFCF